MKVILLKDAEYFIRDKHMNRLIEGPLDLKDGGGYSILTLLRRSDTTGLLVDKGRPLGFFSFRMDGDTFILEEFEIFREFRGRNLSYKFVELIWKEFEITKFKIYITYDGPFEFWHKVFDYSSTDLFIFAPALPNGVPSPID